MNDLIWRKRASDTDRVIHLVDERAGRHLGVTLCGTVVSTDPTPDGRYTICPTCVSMVPSALVIPKTPSGCER